MVKLDVSMLKHLSKDDFRVLTALEMGMKNHDLVPTVLINSLSNLKFGARFVRIPRSTEPQERLVEDLPSFFLEEDGAKILPPEELLLGGCHKALMNLHKHKLIYHQSKPYDGYRLTYAGYDYLVLKTMVKRGSVTGVGRQIGVGKESDIFIVVNDKGDEMAFKFHRLGRTSFRSIKRNRDYHQHRKSASWLYLSRLAALKEHSYMKALHDAGFPVPRPVDFNRHGICMELIHAYPLAHVNSIRHPDKVYLDLMNLLVRLAQHGVIHGDFNEFNLMIDDEERITLIDFPQMVSIDHENAEFYFDRDVTCIRVLFERRYGFVSDWWPKLNRDTKRLYSLDKEVAASGFTRDMEQTFEQLLKEQEEEEKEAGEVGEEEEEDTDEDVGDDVKEVGKEDGEGGDDGEKGEGDNDDLEKNINEQFRLKGKKKPIEEKKPAKSTGKAKEKAEQPLVKETTPSTSSPSSSPSTPVSAPSTAADAPSTGVDDSQNEAKSIKKKSAAVESAEKKAMEGEGEESGEEGEESGSGSEENSEESEKRRLQEIARRQTIQKKVKSKIAHQERRKKGMKNSYKNRDRRAMNADVKAQGEW